MDEYKTIAEKTCEVNKCIFFAVLYLLWAFQMISIFKDWKKNDKNSSDKVEK